MPRCNGVTSATSCPARPSALASAATMSPSPPLLEYGWTSLLASISFIVPGGALPCPAVPCPSRGLNPLCLQISPQRLRNQHAAVRLLMRLDQSDEQSRQRRSAAIEDVRKTVLSARGLVAQAHPAGLEVLAIGATAHLQIAPLPWRPDFDVVRHGAGETHVARAELDDFVVQPKSLQHFLRVADHRVEFGVTLFRFHDLDQLDLVELVHANHPARADARRARLRAKARAVGHVTNRKLRLLQNFLAMNVGDRRFGRGQQIELAQRAAVQPLLHHISLVLEFR